MAIELNIDGLVGPTHNYAGLSFGNIASAKNKGKMANPKAAALQGISKMRALIERGIPQALMPPHERPFIPMLKQIGFSGSDSAVLESAWKSDPTLVANMSSAAAMWTANAATFSPSIDCDDAKAHITPANLVAMPHRSIESVTTCRLLRKVFKSEEHFTVHDALPPGDLFGDEGAANHNRLAADHGSKGLEIFVYGRRALAAQNTQTRFPGRQTFEASKAVARWHKLHEASTLHAKQNDVAIDAGAFHNDVVCVANGPVLLYHELAFDDANELTSNIRKASEPLGFDPVFISAENTEFSIEDAVKSYFFNSQLVTGVNGDMFLVLPIDAAENVAAKRFADACVAGNNPIKEAIFLDVRQSMRNGGGPACLRLRVQLTDTERDAIHQPVIMDQEKLLVIEDWVSKHYRDRLLPEDIGDPALMRESQSALDELTQILELGSIYHFQCKPE